MGQVAIISGVVHYGFVYGTWSPLGIANAVVFFSVLLIIEVIFRSVRRGETPYASP